MGFYSPNSLVQDAQRHGVIVLPPDVNLSAHDCTVEPAEAEPDDIAVHMGRGWRRGRGPVDDPVRPAVAVRLGLRYVRHLGGAEIARLETARLLGGPFTSPEDLAHRSGLGLGALEGLAAAGGLASLGLGRREGLWAAGALAEIHPGRLAMAPGVQSPPLPGMTEEEAHRADLWATGISVRHPIEFVRERLGAEGCLPVAEVLDLRRPLKVRVGGVVTHRQRPSTSNGVVFINLEDETGLLNVVVMPDVWDAQRDVARKAAGMMIDGTLEHRDGVTNLIARKFWEWPVEGVASRDWGGWR